ncbi:MAG: ECF transporter S component [Solobacterium sp.]|nr:ECF transporter S component [Solobacterium sp.]
MNSKTTDVHSLALSAMFLAVGQVLPFITGQIPAIGQMLLPMHFPIFLCAFIVGPRYAAIIGFICPLLRSVLFGMPVMFPNGIGMAFELMAYGAITGIVYRALNTKGLAGIYLALIFGMMGGRVVWGIAQTILLGASGAEAFTFEAFLAKGFLNAIPGIVAQLILIPSIVYSLQKQSIVR